MNPRTYIPIVCASCGKGRYSRPQSIMVEADLMRGVGVPDFVCTECATQQMWDDFAGNEDEGESLEVIDGILCTVSGEWW